MKLFTPFLHKALVLITFLFISTYSTVEAACAPSITGSTIVCDGDMGVGYSTPFSGGKSWIWTTTGGSIASGQGTSSITVNWTTAGSHDLIVTETQGATCSVKDTITVLVLAIPTPSIGGDTSVCGVFTGINYTTLNIPGNTYAWVVTGGNITGGQGTNIVTIDWTGPGTGTLSITESNVAFCTGFDTITVNSYNKPISNVTGTDTVCAFAQNVSYSTTLNAQNTYNWTVVGGTYTGGGLGGSTIIVDWNGPGIGSVILHELSAIGCDSMDTMTVVIQAAPVPRIVGDTALCDNWTNQVYTTNNIPGNTFFWFVGNGNITSGQGTNSITVDWTTPPLGGVGVMETNSSSCSTIDTVGVHLSSRPSPTITGRDSVCENVTGEMYTVSGPVPGNSYTWIPIGGTVASGQGNAIVTIDWGTNGPGSLILMEQSGPGCDSSDTLSVAILPSPTPMVTGDTALCDSFVGIAYSVTNIGGNTYTWGISGGNITAGQNTNSVMVTWTGVPGIGRIFVTETNPAVCVGSDTLEVELSNAPVPMIVGNDSVCEFARNEVYATPNVPSNFYTWTISGGLIGAGQGTNSIAVTWSNAGMGQLILTESSGLGCATSDTMNVFLSTYPAPVITGDTAICDSIVGIAYTTAATGNTFNWSVIGGGSVVGGQGTNTAIVDWAGQGLKIVTVTETNATGCDSTLNFNVAVGAEPSTTVMGADSVCANDTGSVFSTSANALNTYDWVVTGGTVGSGQGTNQITVNWGSIIGSASVTVTETAPGGCDSTHVKNLMIFGKPKPTISGPDSVCGVITGLQYYTQANPGDTYNWLVSGGSMISGQGTDTIVVDWSGSGTGFIQLTQSNASGCDSTLTINVIFSVVPSPTVSGVDTTCSGQNNLVFSATGAGNSSWFWSIPGGIIQVGQGSPGILASVGGAPISMVIVEEIAYAGCSALDTHLVTILNNPSPVLTGPDIVCNNTSGVVYSVPNVPGNTYLWGITGGTISSGQGTDSLIVNWGAAGSGTITLTQDNGSCDTVIITNVTILGLPTPSIIGTSAGCEGKVSSYSTQKNAGFTYNWVVSNGSIISGQGSFAADVLWGTAGSAWIAVNETFSAGCSAWDTVFVTVNPTPNPVISGPDSVCVSQAGTIFSTPFETGVSYAWTVNGGAVSSGQGTDSVFVNWGPNSLVGAYVRVTASNSSGCDSVYTYPVAMLTKPIANIFGPSVACIFQSGIAYSVNVQPGFSYSWFANGGTVSSGQGTNAVMVTAGGSGTLTVGLTLTNTAGCSDADSNTINLQPRPVAGFTFTNTNNQFSFTNTTTNSNGWHWDFGDGDTSVVQHANHTYTNAGQHTVCLISSNNCGPDTICDTVDVLLGQNELQFAEEISLYPNPNNGLFTVSGTLLVSGEMKLEIVSMLGQTILERRIAKAARFEEKIDLSGNADGIYMLKLISDNAEWSQKIVIRK